MEDFIPTRCARVKKNTQENFVSVEFTAYKKKVKQSTDDNDDNNAKNVNHLRRMTAKNHDREDDNVDIQKKQELEMKRARYDVIKFGMSGFDNIKAQKAKVSAAIALGACPPKNKRINYKKLKERKEMEKQEAQKKEEYVSGADKSLKKSKVRKHRHRKDTGILGVYGKVDRTSSKV